MQVKHGNALAEATARLIIAAINKGTPVIVEQPAQVKGCPHMFMLPIFQEILKIPGVRLLVIQHFFSH